MKEKNNVNAVEIFTFCIVVVILGVLFILGSQMPDKPVESGWKDAYEECDDDNFTLKMDIIAAQSQRDFWKERYNVLSDTSGSVTAAKFYRQPYIQIDDDYVCETDKNSLSVMYGYTTCNLKTPVPTSALVKCTCCGADMRDTYSIQSMKCCCGENCCNPTPTPTVCDYYDDCEDVPPTLTPTPTQKEDCCCPTPTPKCDFYMQGNCYNYSDEDVRWTID